jgi:hypothetical protein
MTAKRLCWTVRGIIALNWLAMGLILAVSNVPKNLAMSAFGVFRICAVCAVAYLLYESSLVTQKRATTATWVVDGLLVLSMFLFWFAVSASTF